ncbi:MAG: hypothetical protein ACJ0F0_03115 [Burkholderiaceae bacterium]
MPRNLLRILPAVVEKDFNSFASGLNEIQRIMGNYFLRFRRIKFLSKEVETLVGWLTKNYNIAYGQSSWGPTGFAIFESHELLIKALNDAKKERLINSSMHTVICEASNVGASVEKLNDS